MGGEGHMLDMIRRLKEGRDSSRLRRERNPAARMMARFTR